MSPFLRFVLVFPVRDITCKAAHLSIFIRRNDIQPVKVEGKFILEKLCHFFMEESLDLFLCMGVIVRILHQQDPHIMVGLLDKLKLRDPYDAVGNLHQVEGGGLGTVLVFHQIVDAALDRLDIANPVSRHRCGSVADLIIDEREIFLKQGGDDHSAVVSQLVIVVIDVDYMSVTVDIIKFLAGELYNAASGLGASIGVKQAVAEGFGENLSRHVVNHLAHRRVELRLVDLKVLTFCVKSHTYKAVAPETQHVRLVRIQFIDDIASAVADAVIL